MKKSPPWLLSFKRSALAIACSSVLLTGTTFAQDTSFGGRVSDASNTVYFEGAKVTIKELGIETITARDGSFHFSIPEGNYTLEIVYLGATTVEKEITVAVGIANNEKYIIGEEANAMDNIIVYGQRAGQAGSINRQKNANTLMSIVSADTIGQSPDQNAAEALQRLPGISIQRDQGEGRFVSIRGIDPNLNNVSINGVNVPSPEGGVRSVAMDVIPSELIQSLEVSKTVTPDMDGSAIGGSIEVKSLSAFDREGRSYSATVQASYNELMEDTSPKISGSYTDIFDLSSGTQLGIATAVSWFERSFGSQNVETDGGWSEFEFEDTATGEDVEVFSAEEIEQRYYEITRERLGAAINFDLQTSSVDKYYLRTLYSKFSDDEYRLRNEYKFDKGEIDLASMTDSSAQFNNAEMDRDTKDRYEEQEIFSLVLGGENQLEEWFIEYNLGYSKSTENEPGRIDTSFNGEDFDLGYLSTGAVPQLTQTSAAQDLNNFALDEITYENNTSEDDEVSFKLDVTRDFVWNTVSGEVKFGLKHQSREKFSDAQVTVYDGGFDDVMAQQFITASPSFDLGSFGSGINRETLNQFVNTNLSSFDINEIDSSIDSDGNSYISYEDINAAYAMVSFSIDKWHIVTGLRYEDTKFETKGNKVELIVDDINDQENVLITPWHAKKEYSHLLPSINVKYSASDKLLVRFAYTETIARPSFGDSAAFQIIESETTEEDGVVETERNAEVGNPDLDPYESNNLDLSAEYYTGNIGVLSAGIFYKDINNYIENAEVQDNGQWDGFKDVNQMINRGRASLTGLELAWTKNFKSGLFISANGTFINADEALPNQADVLANLMLGYENQKFSARLSTNYKSESYQEVDNDASVYEDEHLQVDLSAKYYINNTMQVYFNAINLTNEALYLYHGSNSLNYQYEEYGSSFEIGFTINSL